MGDFLFEFDAEKSVSNKAKHGVDFVEAQKLWDDVDAIEIAAKSDSEKRFALLADLTGKIWIAFYTYRIGRIRIISVRRARKKEEEIYYANK